MKNKNNKIRKWIISSYVIIIIAMTIVFSQYPYQDSLLLKIAYAVILLAGIFGIWMVWNLTR